MFQSIDSVISFCARRGGHEFDTVKLVTLQGKKKQTARETQVVLLRRLIRKLHHVAEARGCSINQLSEFGGVDSRNSERVFMGNSGAVDGVVSKLVLPRYLRSTPFRTRSSWEMNKQLCRLPKKSMGTASARQSTPKVRSAPVVLSSSEETRV